MDDATLLSAFFATWAESDADKRATMLAEVLSEDCTYSDPNCPAPMQGAEAINQMLGMFSANMPGGSARLVGKCDGKNGYTRSAIAFEMNGDEMMRGQYFAHRDGDKLTMIVGFMGMGDA